MSRNAKAIVCRIAQDLGVKPVPDDWCGIDPVVPLIERMSQDGAVVIIKFDGERTGANDNGPYTFLVSSGPLGKDHIRIDTDSIESGLAYIISEYDEKVWNG